MTIRAILDTTAIQAYATSSTLAVGELIGEFSDEGVQFGLPILCLIEAATGADEHAHAMIAVLTEHPAAAALPLDTADWRRLAAATELLGGPARACAALPVVDHYADYLITAEPEAYPGIDVIGIEP